MSNSGFSKDPHAVAAAQAPLPAPQATGAPAFPPVTPGEAAAGRDNWYRQSGVIECGTCEGQGFYWNGRGNGGNDPDSFDIDCEDCDGAGHFPCAVCGNTVPVAGFDCLACDTAREAPGLSPEQIKVLQDALGVSLARAAESYVPAGVA